MVEIVRQADGVPVAGDSLAHLHEIDKQQFETVSDTCSTCGRVRLKTSSVMPSQAGQNFFLGTSFRSPRAPTGAVERSHDVSTFAHKTVSYIS